MDIDDILQNLNSQHLDRDDPFAAGSGLSNGHNTGPADLQTLTRTWINERGTAELLPWPKDTLIERTLTRIRAQTNLIETLTGDMDPKSNFALIIIQTELSRWQFLIRSLLRARIAKIDKHTLHYLSSEELMGRMSENELAYARRHQQLLHGHYLACFLQGFPQNLRGLNDTAGGINMVQGPDEEGGVFVRCLGGTDGSVVVYGRGRDVDGDVEVERGEVIVVRWADVRELVEKGEMELV